MDNESVERVAGRMGSAELARLCDELSGVTTWNRGHEGFRVNCEGQRERDRVVHGFVVKYPCSQWKGGQENQDEGGVVVCGVGFY